MFFLFGGYRDRSSVANVGVHSKSQKCFLDRSYQRKSRSRPNKYIYIAQQAKDPCHPIHWTVRAVSLWPLIPEQVFTLDLGSAPAEGKFKFMCPYYGFIQHVFSPPRSCSARILNFMVARFVSRWDPDKLNYCVRAKGRSNNRTVGDLNGHPRKIINTKITVRMDTTPRQTDQGCSG